MLIEQQLGLRKATLKFTSQLFATTADQYRDYSLGATRHQDGSEIRVAKT
jgi:hypothetical protein